MALAATALAYQSGSYGVPAPHGLDRQYASYRNENPSMPENIEGQSMPNDRDYNGGKFLAEPANDIPAFKISHRDYLKLVSRSMHEDAGDLKSPAKVIAGRIQCSDKTAQSWLNGETAPAGIYDLRAMNRLPAYAALKRRLAALESDLDPRVQAKIQELHRMTLELAGGK